MLAPVLITPPAASILAIEDVLLHLPDHADFSAELAPLIEAATSHLDGWSGVLGRCLITQTWAQSFARWGAIMRLPFPAQAIASVAYWADDVETTLPASALRLHTDGIGSYAAWSGGAEIPGHDSRDDAITITFAAGYGDDAADVPKAIRQAALLLVAHWFRNREAVTDGKLEALPLGVRALLSGFTRRGAVAA